MNDFSNDRIQAQYKDMIDDILSEGDKKVMQRALFNKSYNDDEHALDDYSLMNKLPSRSRFFVVASIGTLVLGSLVLTVILFVIDGKRAKPSATRADQVVNSATLSNTQLLDQVAEEAIGQSDSPVQAITIERLIQECPEPFVFGLNGFGVLSEECVSMLEPFFIDLPYIPNKGFQWLQIPDRISYRRIFEDPMQDRELVLDALSRAECRFEDGEIIRPDLRETCHAESFYTYSSFIQICKWYRDSRDLFDYDLYSSKINIRPSAELWEEHLTQLSSDAEGNLNQAQYSRLKQDVWHTSLATHWYRRKCQEYDMKSIELDFEARDAEYYRLLTRVSEQLNIFPPLGLMPTETVSYTYDVINLMAAHLGEYSASIVYSQLFKEPFFSVDISIVLANREQHPWMQYFASANKLKDFRIFPSTNEDVKSASTALERGYFPTLHPKQVESKTDYRNFTEDVLDGLLVLEEAGIDYDFPALIDHLCRRLPDDLGIGNEFKCRNVIEELNSDIKLSFNKALVLDEFKKIAIELGVWD